MDKAVLKSGRFFCPSCGAEVADWNRAAAVWHCAHAEQWGEFMEWLAVSAPSIKDDLLAHKAAVRVVTS